MGGDKKSGVGPQMMFANSQIHFNESHLTQKFHLNYIQQQLICWNQPQSFD